MSKDLIKAAKDANVYYHSHPAYRRSNIEQARKKYFTRKASGECVRCGRMPAIDTSVFCLECRSLRRGMGRQSAAKRRKNPEYATRQKVYYDAWDMATKGSLERLKSSRASSLKCVRKRAVKFTTVGLCCKCGKQPYMESIRECPISNLVCITCYMKSAARLHLGSSTLWKILLDKLENQNYLCPYTGDTLILGINASVDHIKPKSKFSELQHDPVNIEWVTLSVNKAKQALTQEEFLHLVKKIANLRCV